MITALIDNGSLEAAAHLNLRRVAAALTTATGMRVEAVSWKHSDRVPATELQGEPAWTIGPWVRHHAARGEREFVFLPFFISSQGAIGSALHADLVRLQAETGPWSFHFTEGLAARGALPRILAARVREAIATRGLHRPRVVVVDHGGPSAVSAEVRNQTARAASQLLGDEVSAVAAASMEGEEHAHNHPLLADQLRTDGWNRGDIVVAPLFLSPGRHAGPDGDVAEIIRAAEHATAGTLRVHMAGLIGTHELATAELTTALHQHLNTYSLSS
jgi:sirohydrochlorin ferrochelatase